MRNSEQLVFRRWAVLGLGALALLLSGCQSKVDTAAFVRARFFLESKQSDGYAALVTLPISLVRVPIEGEAIVSEFDYAAVEVAEVEFGKCLVFLLKPAAARAFYQISVANQGKRLVLVINGEPLGARRIDGPISDGRIYVFLEATDSDLETLAGQLKETNRLIQKQLDG